MNIQEYNIKHFKKYGFAKIEKLLNKEEIALCLKSLKKIEEIALQNTENTDFSFENTDIPKLRAVFNSKNYSKYINYLIYKKNIINNIIKNFTSHKTYELVGSICWYKKPKIGSSQPWHQDLAYRKNYREKYDLGVNLWIALDDTTSKNGCLNFISASHKSDLVHHNKTIKNSREVLEIDIKKTFPNNDAVPLELKAGDAVLFNWLCAHCSNPNISSKQRRAISFGVLMNK